MKMSWTLSVLILAALPSCKQGTTAVKSESVNSGDQNASETVREKELLQKAIKELEQHRTLVEQQLKSEKDTILEMEQIKDGAARVAKISTSIAVAGTFAAAATGVVVGGAIAICEGATYATAVYALLGPVSTVIAGNYSVVAASAAVFGATGYVGTSMYIDEFFGKKADSKQTLDKHEYYAAAAVKALQDVNTALANARNTETPASNGWSDTIKNMVTFGWYDVNYVQGMLSNHEVIANLYAKKIDLLNVLNNDARQRLERLQQSEM